MYGYVGSFSALSDKRQNNLSVVSQDVYRPGARKQPGQLAGNGVLRHMGRMMG
jgi:signal recognition particle GTPase